MHLCGVCISIRSNTKGKSIRENKQVKGKMRSLQRERSQVEVKRLCKEAWFWHSRDGITIPEVGRTGVEFLQKKLWSSKSTGIFQRFYAHFSSSQIATKREGERSLTKHDIFFPPLQAPEGNGRSCVSHWTPNPLQILREKAISTFS